VGGKGGLIPLPPSRVKCASNEAELWGRSEEQDEGWGFNQAKVAIGVKLKGKTKDVKKKKRRRQDGGQKAIKEG